MNLEIKKDSTHSFAFPRDVFGNDRRYRHGKVAITTATIGITTADGEVLLAPCNMTIATDTFSATKSWDAAGQPVGQNLIVTFTINGSIFNRFADIYNYPFLNTVCDDNLFAKDRALANAAWRVSGKATGGSTSTLVDTSRIEDDDFFTGGMIELFFDDHLELREITSFVKSSGTITFTPVTAIVTAGLGYAARESFQADIDQAAEEVQERFAQIEKRAYLLIDHGQMKGAIVNRTMANYWRQKIKTANDEFAIKADYYANEYESYFKNTIWKYDEDGDAKLRLEEQNESSRVRWHR